MPRPIPSSELRRFGTVEIAPIEGGDHSGPGQSNCRYSWRPDPNVWQNLLQTAAFPIGLSMDCEVGPDGCRRFTPVNGAIGVTADATILGSALFDASGRTRPEDDFYSASAIQLWSIAPKLRELFGRRFKRLSDLRTGRTDVLPDELGIAPGSNGRRWTTSKLLRIGKQAAREAGQRANVETCIQYGLYEAAKLNPIPPADLMKSNVRRILRHCLFDLGPSETAVDKEMRRLVRDRFIKAVQRHGRLSTDAFQRWMNQDFNNIVHQIAKKTRPGGPIDRVDVRQALVEESFHAHFHVAQAMDQGMRAFVALLPQPLTRKERVIFATWFFSQSWLGGLTVLMLRAHFPALKPAILGVLNGRRCRRAQGALIRLLMFYGEMAMKRREADREVKKRRLARNVDRQPAKYVDRETANLVSRPARDNRLDTLVEHIVETRSMSCKCRRQGRWVIRAVNNAHAQSRVSLRCERCGQVKNLKLTVHDIRKLRAEFAE